MQSLIRRLNASRPKSEHFDPDRSRVHCLAHILHLAVMQLMIELKATKKPESASNTSAVDLAGDLSTEEAEKLEADYDENDVGVDDGSVATTVKKASDKSHCHTFHTHLLFVFSCFVFCLRFMLSANTSGIAPLTKTLGLPLLRLSMSTPWNLASSR